MGDLFDSSTDNVGVHLKNIFADKELDEAATTEDFSVVQSEGSRRVRRQVKHYNLDAIVSVGYRVNSRRGVRFRQWATTTLREHLVRGYALNRQRFEDNARELESALALVRKAASGEALTSDQGRGLVDIIARYTQTFLLLQRYDTGRLAALLGNLDQTVFGEPAYPTIEAKAAHLLYFVIKNHPFSDGNKRIGSFLFVEFLHRNDRLARGGEPVINDVGFAALALLVAESAPKDKEVMVRLVMNMLAGTAP